MNVLEEAAGLINGQRSKDYGHPRDNFKNIADLWTAYLGWEIKPLDVGLMMVLLKVARLENGVYHRDSVIDIAGYAGTLERIFEELIVDPFQRIDPMPRVWQSFELVPAGVAVTDKAGDRCYGDPGCSDLPFFNQFVPFTEVLETDA